MAWVTPRTFVAAAVLTAAQLNETRDNLKALLPLDIVAFTSYTPTLTQSGAVTKTVVYAKYQQVGKWVVVIGNLAATGAGTANNKVTVTLPVTAATTNQRTVGSGDIVDASAVTNNPCLAMIDTTTTLAFLDSTQATGALRMGQTGTVFSVAFASGDEMYYMAHYEVA